MIEVRNNRDGTRGVFALKDFAGNGLVRVGRSNIAGAGLFATVTCAKNKVLCEYTGELLPHDAEPNPYALRVNDKWLLDGSPMSNMGRWANHSCEPNAIYIAFPNSRVFIATSRLVLPGEEITVDYGKGHLKRWAGSCRCPQCRKD